MRPPASSAQSTSPVIAESMPAPGLEERAPEPAVSTPLVETPALEVPSLTSTLEPVPTPAAGAPALVHMEEPRSIAAAPVVEPVSQQHPALEERVDPAPILTPVAAPAVAAAVAVEKNADVAVMEAPPALTKPPVVPPEPLKPQATEDAPPVGSAKSQAETGYRLAGHAGECTRNEPTGPKLFKYLIAVLAFALVTVAGGAAWWFLKSPAGPAAAELTLRPEVVADEPSVVAPAPEKAPEAAAPSVPAPAEPAPAAPPDPVAQAPEPAVTQASVNPALAAKAAEEKRLAAERKRQAAEEKRRKAEEVARARAEREAAMAAQRPVEHAPAPTPAPQPRVSSTQEQVAQCQRQNFLQREICMLKVCNNKWGRDGCPAYQQNKRQEF